MITYILGDSEAHGGLTADIVITEEDDESDIEDDEEEEDSDELSKMLDQASLNASANVKIKQEPIDPLANLANIRDKLTLRQIINNDMTYRNVTF